ncbi:hypothetical protein AM571_CH01427 [Rhizobium etli 8C-3]|uniref:Uncharacterized protein n=1 Tax=Rhizobium etli 8C-3 TaxID=538025 RepID=A0A1L5P269_RHIET|nr:hypothetical protein [Rhizobium etli]APO74262.1 hypothetical protein AM571_CH01427 [Rhizobium etli 8C-3]
MSNLTRRNALAQSVLAAVRGKLNGRDTEEERPEDMEDDAKPEGEEDADATDTDPDAEAEQGDEQAESDTEEPKDDEGDTEEPKASAKQTAGIRRAEQGRIQSILNHPKAASNPGLAAELAFGKKFYSAEEAGALLDSSAAGGSRLADRMQGRSPQLGSGNSGGAQTERQSVVAAVGNVVQAMHGRKQKGA